MSRQLERVIGHPIFRKSENLRAILTFLVEQAVASPGVNHKEHEIATTALGRSDDFDPRLDSTVRVHTARLRTKLAEYYAAEGEQDPVLFEIPKGAYQLNARRNASPPPDSIEEESAGTAAPASRPRWRSSAFWGWLIAAAAAGVSLYLWSSRERRELSPSLDVFWADFVKPGEEDALVFSPPKLIGSAAEGLRFAMDSPAPADRLIEDYTGTGEVYGIGALAGLFGRYAKPIRIKRGRLLTWDDARSENLIFVGGPRVNLQLGELPELQRFKFSDSPDRSFLWDAMIDDKRPGAERTRYGNSGRPYTYDHAVIARMKLATNRKMLLLAGTTTVGTQAAVDFVVREETARALLAALKVPGRGPVPGFEALLSVKVSDGVPVHSRILAVHLRK